MVQFGDIFPALLLVGCAGKTVPSCVVFAVEALCFCWGPYSPPCPSFIEDRRRSSSLPGRSSGVLLSGCGGCGGSGGSPGPPPMLISVHPFAFVFFCFFFFIFVLKQKAPCCYNMGCSFLRTQASIRAQVHARTQRRARARLLPCVTSLSAVLLNPLDIYH